MNVRMMKYSMLPLMDMLSFPLPTFRQWPPIALNTRVHHVTTNVCVLKDYEKSVYIIKHARQ